MKKSFSNEEMREILTGALKKHYWELERVQIEDLEKAAKDLGIDHPTLVDAIDKWEKESETQAQIAKERKQDRQQVIWHLIVFLAVNSALLFDNAFRGANHPMHWIILGWGIGLVSHILKDWFGWDMGCEKKKARRRKTGFN